MAQTSEKTYEECLELAERYRVCKVFGVNYMNWFLPHTMAEQIKLMQQLPLREDDVITIGYPRSGNHWTFEVVSMILRQNTEFNPNVFFNQLLELREDIFNMLEKEESPRQMVTHFQPRCLSVRDLVEKKVKIVYLIRNPKDALVSLFKYFHHFKPEVDFLNFQGTFEDYLRLQLAGDFPYGSWFDHVLGVEEFAKNHPEVPVYFHVFEEMRRNPEESVRKLCDFLGYSGDLASSIVDRTEIESMADQAKFHDLEDMSKTKRREIVVTGKIGGWKEFLTVGQNERIDAEFEKKMAGSRLGDLVRPYMK